VGLMGEGVETGVDVRAQQLLSLVLVHGCDVVEHGRREAEA